jgi:hypothetical protein
MALGGPVFNAILEVAKRGRLHLPTSAFCYLEAWRNVELKVPDMKSSCFLPLSRGSYSLGLSDRRLARRVLFLEGRLRKDFL